mmetsp:Transcript_109730/g.353958  ORF Transcript_109730/g.353958 Transcript_109730/m.353958 type:complete len:239 (-) Transcript_109730:3283-3999(-)
MGFGKSHAWVRRAGLHEAPFSEPHRDVCARLLQPALARHGDVAVGLEVGPGREQPLLRQPAHRRSRLHEGQRAARGHRRRCVGATGAKGVQGLRGHGRVALAARVHRQRPHGGVAGGHRGAEDAVRGRALLAVGAAVGVLLEDVGEDRGVHHVGLGELVHGLLQWKCRARLALDDCSALAEEPYPEVLPGQHSGVPGHHALPRRPTLRRQLLLQSERRFAALAVLTSAQQRGPEEIQK